VPALRGARTLDPASVAATARYLSLQIAQQIILLAPGQKVLLQQVISGLKLHNKIYYSRSKQEIQYRRLIQYKPPPPEGPELI
jgi:hypothetical protein